MVQFKTLAACLVAAPLCFVPQLAVAQATPGPAPAWSTDPKTNCKVWNPAPAPNETVSWSGGCENSLAQGKGVVQWIQNGKPGSRSEGEYLEGRANGLIVTTWPDGRRAEREFRAGIVSGRSIVFYPSGRRLEQEWRDNSPYGPVKVTFEKDGGVYEGDFSNNKPNGLGVWVKSDREVFYGLWRSGCFLEGQRKAFLQATVAECGF